MNEDEKLEQQSLNSLQKLNPYYIFLSDIYKPFTILLSSQRLGVS